MLVVEDNSKVKILLKNLINGGAILIENYLKDV